VAANLFWNVLTFRRFGHVGLALGTSLAALVNFSILAVAFHRRIHRLFTRDLVVAVLKIVAAAAIMAAAIWAVSSRVELLPGAGVTIFAVKAFVPIVVGAAVYFGAARAFGLDEARSLVSRFGL